MSSPHAPLLAAHRPDLHQYEALYKHFHAHPELSDQEVYTAARIGDELRRIAGENQVELNVRRGIGGTGVVAVLEVGAVELHVSRRCDFFRRGTRYPAGW